MHQLPFLESGELPNNAKRVLICIHGRGGSAKDILSLKSHLNIKDAWLIAPQADHNTWYPLGFMSPTKQNQPYLNAALDGINKIVAQVLEKGFKSEQIYFLGFSQGACLTLEYVARNVAHYGGVVAFTGGLIGEKLTYDYQGDFKNTPFLFTAGDKDPHVPLERILESEEEFKKLNAQVRKEIFPGKPHSISMEEIEIANEVVFG